MKSYKQFIEETNTEKRRKVRNVGRPDDKRKDDVEMNRQDQIQDILDQ